VNFAVLAEAAGLREPFAANAAFERFLSRMTTPVYRQQTTTAALSATFCVTLSVVRALVFICVNIPVPKQRTPRPKLFLTLRAWIREFFDVSSTVYPQVGFPRKPLVTHSTHERSWLVIALMLSGITITSFSSKLHGTPCISTM